MTKPTLRDEVAAFAADVQAECNRRHRAHVCGELCFSWCIDAACLSDPDATKCYRVIQKKRSFWDAVTAAAESVENWPREKKIYLQASAPFCVDCHRPILSPGEDAHLNELGSPEVCQPIRKEQ